MRKIALAKICVAAVSIAWAAPLPTPEQFAGFRMGTDKKLLRCERIVEYMKLATAASPRIRVEELGKTTNGNPFPSVTIASTETQGRLDHYKSIQQRLAYPRDLGEAEAEKM